MLTTQLLRLTVILYDVGTIRKKKNQTIFFFTSVVSERDIHTAQLNEYTFSSVVAAWNADQNDPDSNLFCVLIFLLFFKGDGLSLH